MEAGESVILTRKRKPALKSQAATPTLEEARLNFAAT
jgi:hypothetical protein